MPCQAPDRLEQNYGPVDEDLSADPLIINDFELNLNVLNKYFQVNSLDETLEHRREQFRTRQEHLQKRQEAFHEREIALKERMISYEMYVKELAMKQERSVRRMEEEKKLIRTKQMEIKNLQEEIQQKLEEKAHLEDVLRQYQPHWNLLTQMVDQTDRFQSIDEMIDKFDMLHASYQDVLAMIHQANEQLNDSQRGVIIATDKKKSQIALMNNRKMELEEQNGAIQEKIDRIQIEIENCRRISKEHQADLGAINIAIDCMFELVRKYSSSFRRKHWQSDESPIEKLKRIDTCLSDLTAYVEHVQRRTASSDDLLPPQSSQVHRQSLAASFPIDVKNPLRDERWRSHCEKDQSQILMKSVDSSEKSPSVSYKVRGDDNLIYTIQISLDKTLINRKNQMRRRASVSPKRSSISLLTRSKDSGSRGRRNSSFRPSLPTIQASINASNRIQRTQERLPFVNMELIR